MTMSMYLNKDDLIDDLRMENRNLRAKNKQLLSALSRAYGQIRSQGTTLIDALDIETWNHDARDDNPNCGKVSVPD